MHTLVSLFTPNSGDKHSASMVLGGMWVALMIIVWSFGAASFIPTPLQTIQAFPRLWFDRGLGDALWSSFALNLQAISIMFVLSYSIAVATVMPVFRPFATLVSSGRFNGFVGLPLIFTALLHNPQRVKIALLVFGMGVFTVLSLVKMIQNIPKERFDHSRTLRMSEWRVVWEVVVLGRFDEVMDIVRINIAMGFMLLPLVEGRFKFLGGVGALMEIDSKQFDMAAVFAATITILALGLVQDYCIGVLKHLICPYASLGLERQ